MYVIAYWLRGQSRLVGKPQVYKTKSRNEFDEAVRLCVMLGYHIEYTSEYSKFISEEIRDEYGDQIILHDEDEWDGKYRTYKDMWEGEGYIVEEDENEREGIRVHLADGIR